MIRHLADKYKRNGVTADELMADCFIGFDVALKKFDRNRKVLFKTFAYRLVNDQIMLSDLLFNRVVRVPKKIKLLAQLVNQAEYELVPILGKDEFTDVELTEYINVNLQNPNVTVNDIKNFRLTPYKATSLEALVDETGEFDYHMVYGDS